MIRDTLFEQSSQTLTVITNAPNIRVGTRTVLAEVGTEFEDNETGDMAIVRKELVGGVYSEGMICDSVILGWAGGAAGVAVQVPPSYGNVYYIYLLHKSLIRLFLLFGCVFQQVVAKILEF